MPTIDRDRSLSTLALPLGPGARAAGGPRTRHHRTHALDFMSFRRDTTLHHIEMRLAEAQERQERFRSERHAERLMAHSHRHRGSIRRRLGDSIIRMGERISGAERSITAPSVPA